MFISGGFFYLVFESIDVDVFNIDVISEIWVVGGFFVVYVGGKLL